MARRTVVDTNVLVSGVLIPRSTPAQAIDRILSSDTLLVSPELISELSEVIRRPHFDSYVNRSDRESFLAHILEHAAALVPSSVIDVCRDPRDNHLLALARDGNADYLVTGDDDLLVLKSFHATEIVTAKRFLDFSNK